MDANLIVLSASLVVIASFFFNYLSSKTNIPSVLMLMVLGYIVGQFVEIPAEDLNMILPSLGTVGVILIVLEAALDIHLSREKGKILTQSLILSIVLLLSTAGLSALVMMQVFDMGFPIAFLYSVPLAVMSSAIIIPSVQSLIERKKEFMIFESAFSDIFGIVIFYVLAGALSGEDGMTGALAAKEFGLLLLTLLMAVGLSYGLIATFPLLKGHVRLFLLIAALVALYTASKYFLHLYSALFIVLVFGLILNNRKVFFPGRMDKLVGANFGEIFHDFKTLTFESAFVVRTFFFVLFGMSIDLGELVSPQVWIVSTAVLAAIYLTRYLGLRIFFLKDIFPEFWIAPRGLITVLLFFAIPAGIKVEGFPEGILLLTILISSFIMTFGLIKNGKQAAEKPVIDETETASENTDESASDSAESVIQEEAETISEEPATKNTSENDSDI
ncbi:MAG: cation:proton antiporter [Bacteroidia bacterium]